MDTMLYFSYGSNMSTPRLADRVPSARSVAVALLHAHRLQFHKKGRDGSAKCDCEYTGDARDIVYGVVFRISAGEKPDLDRKEGLNKGYDETMVRVMTVDGALLEALTYQATSIDPSSKPFGWYKEHVLRGACEHRLPGGYIAAIEAVSAVPDPDPHRHERELSIYRERRARPGSVDKIADRE
jgi:gamma-glutamylcyclotransferase